jgi:hypothetical protein
MNGNSVVVREMPVKIKCESVRHSEEGELPGEYVEIRCMV